MMQLVPFLFFLPLRQPPQLEREPQHQEQHDAPPINEQLWLKSAAKHAVFFGPNLTFLLIYPLQLYSILTLLPSEGVCTPFLIPGPGAVTIVLLLRRKSAL